MIEASRSPALRGTGNALAFAVQAHIETSYLVTKSKTLPRKHLTKNCANATKYSRQSLKNTEM
jgi:hypothetical protein